MLNYIGRVMQKTGETVVGLAGSSLVRGASRVGTGALKLGVEGAAGVANKTLKGAKNFIPKIKNMDGKKISEGVGNVVNKTLVGTADDYHRVGKVMNDTKLGKIANNKLGVQMNEDFTPRLGKTTYVGTNSTLGLADAVTDRAKSYLDGATAILKGHQFDIGPMVNNNIKNEWWSKQVKKWGHVNTGLVKTGADNFMPFGLKATALGTTAAIGTALIGNTPEAIRTLNKNRQGTNMDSQPVSMAPTTPAYSNNGGATGDLVFALNNLRHGGMM